MGRPQKIKYPIRLEELLRLTFRRKRIEDRFKFFRMQLRDELQWNNRRLPTKDEIEEAFSKANAREYDSSQAAHFIFVLSENLPIFQRELRQNRAKKAALAKWGKIKKENA